MKSIIETIENKLQDVFTRTLPWFEEAETVRQFKPTPQAWNIDEILEHIALTNHFLLILIDKGAKKALKNLHQLDLAEELKNYEFGGTKLDEVAIHQSFEWIRPEHMEPTGKQTADEVKARLAEQLNRCLAHLAAMPNGEGVLYKTTMTVNNLGKIDVYEYIYFLAQHTERHLTQMERNKASYHA